MMEGEGAWRKKREVKGEGREAMKDKVGLVLSECHVEGRWKCL